MTEFQVQAKHIQKVYEEWCVKAGELILHSRVQPHSSTSSKTSATFGIATPEALGVRSVLDAQTFFSSSHALVIDILNPDAEKTMRVIERWRLSFLPPQGDTSERKNVTLMRKLCVGIRSLLCYTRLLPGYAIFRRSLLEKSPRADTIKLTVQTHTIRMADEAKLNDNHIPNSKHLDFLILPSSIGTLRLRVSHVTRPIGCQPLEDTVLKQSGITDAIQFEEGYVEKEFDVERASAHSKMHQMASDAATSVCSTSPDNNIVFRPVGTPPFGRSFTSLRSRIASCEEQTFQSRNRADSGASSGSPTSTAPASSRSTPRGQRSGPAYPDLQDIWVDRKRDMSPPRQPSSINDMERTESGESAEICIFGLDESDNDVAEGPPGGRVVAFAPSNSEPSVLDELNPFPTPTVHSALSRTVFDHLDSSAAFLDLGDDRSWEK
eukprot:GEMP01009977.1.p1 GENE.GEMP01009977.1~~GEMP01009977.1.p1  ORF type:complete len:436 (-),score=82.73 GEMP01009977.1:1961-3268(-)